MNNPSYLNFSLSKNREVFFLIAIISINLLLKIIPASMIELGNDEVYYRTYAAFPDWSHFDHPPMVGLTIQLFSLNLLLDSAFFLRLGALILSSINIILLFYLVKRIYSQLTGIIAVLLFTSSIYFNLICGLFIMPDTPQIFFILLALYFGLPSLIQKAPQKSDNFNILLFGVFTGLAFLSKYHSLYLWLGAGLFILFKNNVWLKKPAFYLSILLTLVLMIPVIYWNFKNDFISFTFHGDRVGLLQNQVNWVSFIQFNSGQILYQNPVVVFVIIAGIISLLKNKTERSASINSLLLFLSIPLILVFFFFSIFKPTLPHWTGPAFITLLMIGSEYLSGLYYKSKKKLFSLLIISNSLFVIVISIGTLQINHEIIQVNDIQTDKTKIGKNDVTLDMYGWRQAGEKFSQFLERKNLNNPDSIKKIKIISNHWFPAAHLDYYIATPLKIDLIALGSLEAIHKYYWINQIRETDANRYFFITSSQQYFEPENYSEYFGKITASDTLRITRKGRVVKNLFIYEMKQPVPRLFKDKLYLDFLKREPIKRKLD